MVDRLDPHVQQNLIDELKNYSIECDYGNLPEIMCNIFRTILDNTLIDGENNHKIEKENVQPKQFNSEILQKARIFCIDFEKQLNLLVLCQIAQYINPLHKHVRALYTEYLRLDEDVQKAVMHLKQIPVLEFEENWEYSYLELFREDIKKLNLVTEKDLLYDGGKYFHRAMDYAEMVIYNANPTIFPATPAFRIKGPQGDLCNYIDEHLYYKSNEEAQKYVGVPPFDWMIKHLDLLRCPEEELVFWMCLFIYNACHVIPREYGRKDALTIQFNTPNISYAEYMEDLYYMALLALYDIYH